MNTKEIETIVTEIETNIIENKNNYTYRKYHTFFERIGMLNRRNFIDLIRIEREFKKKGIHFWEGNNSVKKLSHFKKDSTITFRGNNMNFNTNFEGKTKVDFAGKIDISSSEKNLIPYKHQEEAFDCLQKNIIKSNKDSFSGLLVLPTGGGKTFTSAWWICKNFLDKDKKVLWIAHRHELLDQAKKLSKI